jgi:GAF domain-containing protein
VLRAGTGEAGQSMLARGHRIRRGEGMIGWCVEQGQARIALDVGADAVRLATAELPSTRSEAALPLRSRGRVLGALTVQSVQPAAFDQDAVTVLQTMADQVAVALDNAQLFAESREALEAARTAYGRLTREAWLGATRTQPNLGFRRDKQGLAPAGAAPSDRRESRSSRVVGDHPAEGGLTAPIQVRGQVIGVIDAHKESWTAEEAATLELLADQVGAALEGARLFRDARRHAAHEQAVRHITEQMRRGLEVEEILQTTVAELGRTLGVPRAYVRLGVANDARNRPDQKESRPQGVLTAGNGRSVSGDREEGEQSERPGASPRAELAEHPDIPSRSRSIPTEGSGPKEGTIPEHSGVDQRERTMTGSRPAGSQEPAGDGADQSR